MTEMRRRIGTFDLLEPISYGATSVVFRGFQPSLERPVAVKQLLPEHLRSPEIRRRFAREAKSIASLSHPGIVQVFDYLREGEDRYIVMEFVEGYDLGRVLELRGRLSHDEAVAVASHVAEALLYGHMRGIIHRDVKPRNILLSRSGLVKVVDFGVAQVIGQDERATATAGFVGTPAYTSPEQVLGKRIDGRTDIFALGIVLYEMLTGSKPFRNDPDGNIVSKILEEEPLPPRAVNPRVGRGMQRIVLRCLEKDPNRRFPDMVSLLTALRSQTSVRESEQPRALARLAVTLFGKNAEISVGDDTTLSRGRSLVARLCTAANLRRASLLGTVAALALLGASLMLFFARGSEAGPGEGTWTGRDEGYVKVVAYPWAEIRVDGELVDTTPTDRAVRLPAGEHQLTLIHPELPSYETTLRVAPGSFQRLAVDLTGSDRFGEAPR